MPISLPVLRAILLGAALLQLIVVLAPLALRRRAVDAALKAGARGQPPPPQVRSLLLSRVPGVLMALVPFVLWWFLGTPGGEAFFSEAFRPR
ncbi:MAG: hypothetical protein IT181_14375 [Acidobacteria bacterium]|nr:hypothetical protein [Acidobacteriota bacterium]